MACLFTPSISATCCPPTSSKFCLALHQVLPPTIDNFIILLVAYQMLLSFQFSRSIGVITWCLYAALIKLSAIYITLPVSVGSLKAGSLFLFAFGWGMQFIGHYAFEGRKPALLDNWWQFNVAPMFIIMEILFFFGFFPDMHKECERLTKQHLVRYRASQIKKR
eukprot:GHVS01100991.1.p1 GENE.GHVS01100991.1~~GHVS01100991.1.p1  ORF type:complete len:164 (+),score=13.92 GHVS01100991.1:335-826(+)